jgi:EAL domain-containing protein (putative c-di-GMP-specific phosphodiesterase class I)
MAFEALLRWHHRERGIVAPQEFLPVAETTGLSIPIGAWVLQQACRQATDWQRATHQGIGVSVNISPRQLRDPGFAEQLRRCLADTSLDPRLLRLEITEGDLLTNGDASAKVLGQLRALNVELHVDDFGTGYSSLSYLPQFPIQAIKIDRAFVHRMGTRRTDLEIVRSIVDLAKTLGLTVIAEGVETVAQRERLLAFGCELGQGFLFSEPVEAADVPAFLTAQLELVS